MSILPSYRKASIVLSFQSVSGFPQWEYLFPCNCRYLAQSALKLNGLISTNNNIIYTEQKWFIWSRFLVCQNFKFPPWEFERLQQNIFILVKQWCCWIVHLINSDYDRSTNILCLAYCDDIGSWYKKIPTVGISLLAIQKWVILSKCLFSFRYFVVMIYLLCSVKQNLLFR